MAAQTGRPDHPHARGENSKGVPPRYYPDHPHARGENGGGPLHGGNRGPSPRAWGEPTGPIGPTGLADHPHARGENPHASAAKTRIGPSPRAWGEPGDSRAGIETCGPSPRAWGERHRTRITGRFRTIPTRVGRTLAAVPHRIDQPGPSPRAWGEPRRLSVRSRPDHPHARGENCAARGLQRDDADHPHARGENGRREYRRQLMPGPSPRAWGERRRDGGSAVSTRTIPTRVGRTRSVRLRHVGTDHPHARGENASKLVAMPATTGPSPRTWGERGATLARGHGPSPRAWGEPVGGLNRNDRTIPTRVGRTLKRLNAPVTADHPHARGENEPGRARGFTGPSPRAWGEPGGPTGNRAIRRTIPTRVGRTGLRSRYRQASAGPSPRMWGERAALDRLTLLRTIPTRVGRTHPARDYPGSRTIPTRVGRTRLERTGCHHADHPHACGENRRLLHVS